MPLTINVGLSRKASKDYQSTGVSINVTAELDQSLLAKPDELQRQIDGLYGQAEQAIDRQVQACAAPEPQPANRRGNNVMPRNGHGNGQRHQGGSNGNGYTSGGATGGGGMTQSQNRAINAIGRRLGLDIEAECHDALRLDFGELSIREASRFIDHLKALEQHPVGAGRNGNGAQASGGRNGGGR